jgi:hypothetical protein
MPCNASYTRFIFGKVFHIYCKLIRILYALLCWQNFILVKSGCYNAQAIGQAEASNKVLTKIIKKRIKDNPRRWHEKLSEALWAHRTSRHGATKVTPFELVYGQEAVLPMEIGLQSLRVIRQGSLSAKEFHELMTDKIDDVHKSLFKALEEIEKEKIKIA